jgi:hypothetical protein
LNCFYISQLKNPVKTYFDINHVTETIDDISKQSNLLALKENPIPARLAEIGFFMFADAIHSAYARPPGGIPICPISFPVRPRPGSS